MDKVIAKLKSVPGYHVLNILRYADDTILVAKTQDDLQQLLRTFVSICKTYV